MTDSNSTTRRYEKMPCMSCGQTDYDSLYKPICHAGVCCGSLSTMEAVINAARDVWLNHNNDCDCGLCKAMDAHDALLEKERQASIAWNDAKNVLPTPCPKCRCIHRPRENTLCRE